MSFYIRKSIKAGPLRFNLSKSGIGISGGVKGFRVGTGPRGNYVHLGAGGVYYRKTLPRARRASAIPPSRSDSEPWTPNAESFPAVRMTEIESADVSNMVHSSSEDLINEIQKKERILRLGPGVLAGSIAVVSFLFWASFHPIFIMFLTAALTLAVYFAFRSDALKKTTVLFYAFDPAVENAYDRLHTSAAQIANCAACWHISASGSVHDRRYHAGASELVNRSTTFVRKQAPPFLKTNVETVAFGVGRQTLYFFPDRILVFASGKVGAVGYEQLHLDVSSTRFAEDGSVPRDAIVVDHTWRYVNKNGSPDRRFSNNRQMPVCLYDNLHFKSRTGLNEVIQISSPGLGTKLAEAIEELARFSQAN